VGVVDVQPAAVGEDDVGQAQVLVGQLGGIRRLTGQVEPAGVPQRVLLLEVPPRPAGPGRGSRLVGVDDLRGGHHRVGAGLAGHGDAVFRLGAHHPKNAHVKQPNAVPDEAVTLTRFP
jgi:hypothetical protein